MKTPAVVLVVCISVFTGLAVWKFSSLLSSDGSQPHQRAGRPPHTERDGRGPKHGVPAGPGIPGEASPPERSPLHRSGDSGKPLPERPVRKYRPGETEEDFLKQKEDEEIIKQRKIRQSVGESPGTHSFVPKQGPQKQRLHPEEPVFLAEGEMAARPSMERAGEL